MIDKATYRILKKLYKAGHLGVDETDSLTGYSENRRNRIMAALMRDGLVEYVRAGDVDAPSGEYMEGPSWYEITIAGRAYIEQTRRDLYYFWVPYILTTVIAVASLFVAVAALFL